MSVVALTHESSPSVAEKLFRFAHSALRPIGIDIRALRTKDRRIVGVQLRLAGSIARTDMGEIVRGEVEGQAVAFFVQNPTDEIQRQHKRGVFYEREELEIIAAHFRGGVFVDAGANVGNHSLYALKFLGAEQVIAFEPNPDAYQILLVNMALNGVAAKVTLHPVGLSDRAGRAAFETVEDNLGATRLNTTSETGHFEVATGDERLAGVDVAFIKIDTEGMELDVLRGMEETIRRCRPAIFVEVQDNHIAGLIAWIAGHGYGVADRLARYPGLENFMLMPR